MNNKAIQVNWIFDESLHRENIDKIFSEWDYSACPLYYKEIKAGELNIELLADSTLIIIDRFCRQIDTERIYTMISTAYPLKPIILLYNRTEGRPRIDPTRPTICFNEEAISDNRLFYDIILSAASLGRLSSRNIQDIFFFETLMANIPDCIFFKDLQGRYLRISKFLADNYSLKEPENAIGKSDFDFYPSEYAAHFSKDEQAIIATGKSLLAMEEKKVKSDAENKTSELWTITTKMPLYNEQGTITGTYGITHDITLKKQEEIHLERERKNLLATLINTMPDCIFIKDIQCRFIIANSTTAEAMGTSSPEELVGKTDFDFYPKAMAQKFFNDEMEIIRTGTPKINYLEMVAAKTEKARWLSTTKIPYHDFSGKVIGIMGIGRDISKIKQAEEALSLSLANLNEVMQRTILAMSKLLETRDPYTAGHQRNVALLSQAIALELGMDGERIKGLYLAALIHDIGKISVPAEILCKPGKLTENEFNLIKDHSRIGHEIIKEIQFPWPIATIILQHHMRLDGSGYPANDLKEEIILESRIISVADVVEGITSHRPYRPGLGIEKALSEISCYRGSLFDPQVVDVCIRLFTEKKFKLA